jgi:hypothetical protein
MRNAIQDARKFSVLQFAIYAGIWFCAVTTVLSIRDIHGEWDHAVCGVWGCSPPIASVIACQGVWGLILFPVSHWLSNRYSARVTRITALTVLGTAIIAFAIIVIYEIFHWFLFVAPASRKYFGHRIALATFTQVDFPVVMLLLSGLYLRWRAKD